MKFFKIFVTTILIFQFFSTPTEAVGVDPRPYPSLPSELNGKGINVSALREILYEPMFIDSENESPDAYSNLEVGTAFVGGQDAINTQISHVETARTENNNNTKICEGYTDPDCNGLQKIATVILPVCSDDSTGACVENLSLKSGSEFIAGVKTGYVNNQYSDTAKQDKYSNLESSGDAFWNTIRTTSVQTQETWPGITERKLPTASSPSKWSVSGVNNGAGTSDYLVNARLSFYFVDGEPTYYSNFTAEVIPFKEITGNDFVPPFFVTRNIFASETDRDAADSDPSLSPLSTEVFPSTPRYPLASYDNPDQGQHLTCAFEEINELSPSNSKCGAAVRFSDGTKVKLTVRIPKELGGWFHGRLSDTDVELVDFNENLNSLTISAESVDVPITSYQFQACDPVNQAYSDLYFPDAISSPDFNQDQFCARSERDGLGSWGQWNASSSTAVSDFTNYELLMDSRAKGKVNTWSISTLPFDENANQCLSDTSLIQAFISTNALVYQAGIPTYSNGKFNYRIASTHLNADANVIRGDYTLVIRTSVARCLWGFGNGEISGSVQVTGASNEEKSSITTISISPEWIRITAIGFTFSESNVALSLSEKKNVTGSAKSTLPPTVGSKSRITIANVAKLIGVEAPAKSRYFISISKESRKVCRFDNGRLLAVKAGNCTVTVTALAPKPKLVRLNGAIQNVESTTLTKQQLVEKLGRTWVPKSAVTISVSKNSRQACYVKGGKLVVKPNSNCEYRLVLSEPRPKPVRVSGTIQVN